MGFRFRRSTRLGPLRFHFTRAGLSSVSIGGRGASLNLPVARSGGPRTTVGIPGTGLSWSQEHRIGRAASPPVTASEVPAPALPGEPPGGLPAVAARGLPNSRRFRPGQLELFKRGCLDLLHERIFAEGSAGRRLWDHHLVSRLLTDPSLGARLGGLLACIETPEALEAYLMRARSQDDAKRRADRCLEAVRESLRLAAARGWQDATPPDC
jgi:hypothetical protein